MTSHFDTDGYLISDPILSAAECAEIGRLVAQERDVPARNMLGLDWCHKLAQRLASPAMGARLIPPDSIAVQCTYFEKSPRRNWLVTLHQDLSIPVAERIENPDLSGWSEKDGVLYTQPPAGLLEQLVAVRLQLDAPGPDDGALRVVAGTHVLSRLDDKAAHALRERIGETTCPVPLGGALFMRPLLLHASSKLRGDVTRRVLHFVFGPRVLPHGLRWAACAPVAR